MEEEGAQAEEQKGRMEHLLMIQPGLEEEMEVLSQKEEALDMLPRTCKERLFKEVMDELIAPR
jgi:hypothetical protein